MKVTPTTEKMPCVSCSLDAEICCDNEAGKLTYYCKRCFDNFKRMFKTILEDLEKYEHDYDCLKLGHDWIVEGGRGCPKAYDNIECSQPVYVCRICGEEDYGYPGGPAYDVCYKECDKEVEKEL